MHDVEGIEHRIGRREGGRNDGEVFRHVVGDAERRERAAGHQHLLAGLDDLEQFRGIGVEVDHVPGFLGGLGPGVHRDGHVSLGERGSVVGAVARHRHQPSLSLRISDQFELGLGSSLGEEVVDARLGGDGRRRQRVVTGDHDGPDPHTTQLPEALPDASLDDVLELDGPEDSGAIGDDERRRALLGDPVDDAAELQRHAAAQSLHVSGDRVGGALADLAAVQVDATHPRLGRERHERGAELLDLALANLVLLLGQDDDAAPFGGLVRQ